MVKPNIGILNALVRITLGFAMLAWATSKMVKRPWRESYFVVAILAAMKVAEGITKFCPLTALFDLYQQQQDQGQQQNQNNQNQGQGQNQQGQQDQNHGNQQSKNDQQSNNQNQQESPDKNQNKQSEK